MYILERLFQVRIELLQIPTNGVLTLNIDDALRKEKKNILKVLLGCHLKNLKFKNKFHKLNDQIGVLQVF